MEIKFSTTKDGLTTCSKGTFRLHSSYNPGKEAERFVLNTPCSFNPKFILITEPCLSYTIPYLQERFPEAKKLCVRYTSEFSDYDRDWDKVFFISDHLSEDIYSYLGEEGISSCLFASWKPSETAFQQEHELCWKEIKKAVLKSRNVLATRSYFAKRWTKNAIRFSLMVKHTAYIKKGSMPVLVCASGPSLKNSIKKIKEIRNKVFLLSVSSALLPLVHEGIIPDLCISTDGGWWAKEHLFFALNKYKIPLALPSEAAAFGKTLTENTIIPLYYGDAPGDDMLKAFKFPLTTASRNGTVSGSAAQLAKEITNGNIYFCGLDLSPSQGYVHTQPNQLELNDCVKDFRLKPAYTRITPSNFSSPALNLYFSWFEKTDFNNRLFRLSDNFNYKNKFTKINDINFNDFSALENDEKKSTIQIIPVENKFNRQKRISEIKNIISKNLNKKHWITNAVPAENIILERATGLEREAEAKEKVFVGMNEFSSELFRVLNLGEKN